jgi:transposase
VREFVYVFAAVCAKLGRLTALILPRANTEMMALFLGQLAQDFGAYFILLLVDRAGWHRAKGLQVPENIRLLPQPAHSPELNPAEHLWENCAKRRLSISPFPPWTSSSISCVRASRSWPPMSRGCAP